MPDEIDLGDGVTAEFLHGEFWLTDGINDEPFELTGGQARKLARFIDEKAGKE